MCSSDLPRVYNDLGQVYLRRGLKKEAEKALRRSLALQPKQEDVRRLLDQAGN